MFRNKNEDVQDTRLAQSASEQRRDPAFYARYRCVWCAGVSHVSKNTTSQTPGDRPGGGNSRLQTWKYLYVRQSDSYNTHFGPSVPGRPDAWVILSPSLSQLLAPKVVSQVLTAPFSLHLHERLPYPRGGDGVTTHPSAPQAPGRPNAHPRPRPGNAEPLSAGLHSQTKAKERERCRGSG